MMDMKIMKGKEFNELLFVIKIYLKVLHALHGKNKCHVLELTLF